MKTAALGYLLVASSALPALFVPVRAGASPADLDQEGVVQELGFFLDLSGPQLHVGKDFLGECRLFIYSQQGNQTTDIWVEGTFQSASGAARGVVLMFLASSSPEKALLALLEHSTEVFSLDSTYSSQWGWVSLGLSLRLGSNGGLSSARYMTSSGERVCSSLKRTL